MDKMEDLRNKICTCKGFVEKDHHYLNCPVMDLQQALSLHSQKIREALKADKFPSRTPATINITPEEYDYVYEIAYNQGLARASEIVERREP